MDRSEIKYYDYNRRLFTFIGLWPYQRSLETQLRIYFISVTLANICIVQTYVLLTTQLKLESFTKQMQTFLPVVCFSFCYYSLVYNRMTLMDVRAKCKENEFTFQLKTILNRIKSDWAQLKNEEELNAMEKYANQSRLCSIAITCVIYIYICFLIFPTFWSIRLYFLGVYNDTCQLELPFNLEYCLKNRTHYFVMLFMQFICICVVSIVGVSYYSMFITFTQHACALFNIVTIKIDEPFRKSAKGFGSTSSTIKYENEFEWIVTVMTYYDESVNFVNLIQSVFGGTYLAKVTLSLMFIFIDFIYFFQLLDFMLSTAETLRNCIFIIGNLFIIYAVSYVGQRLIDHSLNVYTQSCQIPFYLLSLTTQKNLLLFIKRTLKPCRYSLNGIIVSSYETFAKLVNTSYSFAMLCYNMH